MLAERLLTGPVREKPPRKKGRGRGKSKRAREEEARQRRLDMLGLALIALGVYLGYVIYLGWDGGQVGHAIQTGLDYSVGAGAVLVPLALGGFGLAFVLKPVIPERRWIGAGIAVLCAGVLLGLAAQTAGISAVGPHDHVFTADYIASHGGGIGEALYWGVTSLLGTPGAHIIAIGLVIAGGLLLSGRPASAWLGLFGRSADRARRGVVDFATAVRETGRADPDVVDTEPADTERIYGPPERVELAEEPDTNELSIPGEPEDGPGTANFDEAIKIADAREEDPAPSPDIPAPSGAQAGEAEEMGDGAGDLTPMGNKRGENITTSQEIDYTLPAAKMLTKNTGAEKGPNVKDLEAVGRTLLETLGYFGVEAKIVGTVTGPHVSRYELRLAPGTKVSKISQLSDDLAYALASTEIRILAPIPGKHAVGVEVPNQRRNLVRLGDIYGGRPQGSSPLVAWLGKDIAGNAIWTDLQKMPHVLVAGTTGSGKSGCVNAVLSSILLHASPNEVRLVLVDPKRVELNHYESVPHLLTPVVTSPRLAANVLQNLIGEMESRYQIMSEVRARNLEELNRVRKRAGEPALPHILCVIDELGDLMMVAPAEVEDAIIRLAQKSRAVGIHLLLATQRPSTDIITGTIKVNIPARIAFAVSSQVDSRVILDQGGAESLLGQGDMLFRPAGTGKLQRIQGAFITEEEIAKITKHWAALGEPEFEQELLEAAEPVVEEGADDEMSPDSDDLLSEAANLVVESQSASVSMIQRRFRVGYTRAGRLIDMLERRGIISGYEGSKPRQVLVSHADLPRILGSGDARAEAEAEPAEHAVPGAE
ncbi:MAG: DNA translocase FtsK [Solirubrobacterales bacterium]